MGCAHFVVILAGHRGTGASLSAPTLARYLLKHRSCQPQHAALHALIVGMLLAIAQIVPAEGHPSHCTTLERLVASWHGPCFVNLCANAPRHCATATWQSARGEQPRTPVFQPETLAPSKPCATDFLRSWHDSPSPVQPRSPTDSTEPKNAPTPCHTTTCEIVPSRASMTTAPPGGDAADGPSLLVWRETRPTPCSPTRYACTILHNCTLVQRPVGAPSLLLAHGLRSSRASASSSARAARPRDAMRSEPFDDTLHFRA